VYLIVTHSNNLHVCCDMDELPNGSTLGVVYTDHFS